MLEFTPALLNFLRQSHLFSGFSAVQIEQLVPLMREIRVPAGECIIQENAISDELYLIKEGELHVTKLEPTTGKELQLATLQAGAVAGELTLLDDAPRSASVYAVKDSILLVLSIVELRALSARDATSGSPLYSLLLQNLARNLSHRMRSANDTMLEDLRKELASTQARAVMGIVVVTVIVIMSLYALALELLSHTKILTPALLSTPLIAIFSLLVIVAIKKTHYPLVYFGVTLKNWRRSAWEGIVFTLPVLLLIVLYKWWLIHFSPGFATHQLFEFNLSDKRFSHPHFAALMMLVVYVVLVPLQELMVRGALQGPMQDLLVSRHKVLWAILLSNLIFSTTHFHISLGIGLIVYVPGLFWGWLYARHRNLIGVTLSHQLLGVWALFIVGFF